MRLPKDPPRFPTVDPLDAWDFLTITTTEDIADVISITIGPKRPGRFHPWAAGVTLILDDRTGIPIGGIVALSRLRLRAITLPLRALTGPPIVQAIKDIQKGADT